MSRRIGYNQSIPYRTLLRVSILAAHLAGILGLVVVLLIGRARFMSFFLVMALSLIVFDTYYLDLPHSPRIPSLKKQYREALFDQRLAITMALTTFSAFFFLGQGPVLLVFVAVAITLGIGVVNNSSTIQGRAFGLGVIASMSLLLILSESLKGALYSGPGDPLVHLDIIDSIMRTGDTAGAAEPRYMPYLLFHIYIGGVTQLSGLNAHETASLVLGVAFQVAVLCIYLITSREGNPTAGAIAAAILGTLPPVVYAGSLVHYRSLSFVYLVFFFYLLISQKNYRRYGWLLVGISTIWVFTHHISILLAGVFLAAIGIGGMLSKKRHHLISFLIIFGVIFLFRYVAVTGGLREVLTWIFFTSPSAEGVPSRGYQIVSSNDVGGLVKSSLPTFISYIYYVPILGIGGYGLVRALITRNESLDFRFFFPVIAVGFVIFVPNPAWIILEGLAEIPRWHLIAAPFVVIPFALGITVAVSHSDTSAISPSSLLVVFAVVALLVLSAPMNGGVEDMVGYEKQPQRFFTYEEITMMDHAIVHVPDGPIHGYSEVPTYVQKNSPREPDQFQISQIKIPADGNTIRPPKGYTLFSRKTFEKNAVGLSECRIVSGKDICILVIASESEYELGFHSSDRIYTNGGAEILYTPS